MRKPQVQATNDQNTQAEEVAKEEATPVNETNTATEEAPVTSGFRRVATTTADATPAADETATNPADQDVSDQLQNELEKNAIYSPGDPTAKQTYSGKAWVKEKGSVIDGFNANNDKPIAGVNVYLQWVNGKGYVSKVYYTTTNADGTFAIDLSKPEVSSDGTEHKFVIASDGGFAVRTWIKNPDPDKYSVIKQGNQVYGFHTRLNRKNESWDFTAGVNKIVNSQVILQEKMLLEDWLVKPEAEWEKSPNVDGIWLDRGAFGKASGYVWFDNGDAAGTLANQWINDSNDVKATGTRVVGSYLNGDVTILLDNWKKEHKGYSVEDMKAAQAEIITAYEAEHGKGSHISETVVATVDSNGYYYMPFRGLYGKTATDKGGKISEDQWHTLVSDEDVRNNNLMQWNGTAGQIVRHINQDYMYIAPLIDNYNVWTNAFATNMFQDPANFLTNVTSSYNINSVNFALLAPQPMIDVTNYDTTDKIAFKGDVATTVVGGLLPNREYQIQWFRDGKAIGDPTTITSTVNGEATVADFNVPDDITGQTNFTVAIFEQGENTKSLDNAQALDSFIANVPVADSYEPAYKEVEGTIGKDTEPVTPTFTDAAGKDTTAPEGTTFATAKDADIPADIKATVPADAKVLDPADVTVDEKTGVVTVKGSALTGKGTYVTPVQVTYPDGLKDYTYVTVNVAKSATELFEANGSQIDKELGQPTTEDDIKNAVTFKDSEGNDATAPEGTTLPNGNTPGVYEVPVTVTYPDGTTDETTVTVVVGNVIPVDDPSKPTPAGYVRVTFEKGDHGEFAADAKTVFDVKEGTAGSELAKVAPEVTPAEDYIFTAWSPEVPETITAAGTFTAQYKEKDTVAYTAEFGTITKPAGEATTEDDIAGAVTFKDKDGNDTKAPEGTTIKPKEGTTLPNGDEPGDYEVPATVTYPNGTTDEGVVKVTVLGKVIDRTDDPSQPTPEGYVRVTFEAGENGKFGEGAKTVFDVREGTLVSEVTVPAVTANEGFVQKSGADAWSPALPTDTFTAAGTYVAQYEKAATDADKYEPQVEPVEKPYGEPTTADDVTSKVTVPDYPTEGEQPKVTVADPSKLPDGKTPGEYDVPVTVTYPDGSTDEVTVKVTVKESDADKNTLEGQDITTPVGGKPEAKSGIANVDKLPEGTKYEWKTPVDTTTAGEKEGTVVVTYPDGSSEEVTVKVAVTENPTDADKYTPEAKEQKVELNETPNPNDSIGNLGDLPAGTTTAFKNPVDTTTEGTKDATVVVTYPDGSKDEVPVKIVVTDGRADAEKNEPQGKPVDVELGKTPEAKDGIANVDDLPKGTDFTWKEPIDTTTPGEKEGTIVVIYPDGSREEIKVVVNVVDDRKDADKYEPTTKPIEVVEGQVPDAKDTITNLDELPEGTTVEWIVAPNTANPGTVNGLVKVTYPDGSFDIVEVEVVVKAKASNGDKQDVAGAKEETVAQPKPTNVSKPAKNKQQQELPQTGDADTQAASVAGVLMTALAGLFGLGAVADKKKRKN